MRTYRRMHLPAGAGALLIARASGLGWLAALGWALLTGGTVEALGRRSRKRRHLLAVTTR